MSLTTAPTKFPTQCRGLRCHFKIKRRELLGVCRRAGVDLQRCPGRAGPRKFLRGGSLMVTAVNRAGYTELQL